MDIQSSQPPKKGSCLRVALDRADPNWEDLFELTKVDDVANPDWWHPFEPGDPDRLLLPTISEIADKISVMKNGDDKKRPDQCQEEQGVRTDARLLSRERNSGGRLEGMKSYAGCHLEKAPGQGLETRQIKTE